ncbi:hypothetical protein NTD86_01235 [Pseudomonas sp. 7P_10.2_Bac1]|uniref:hypothetical protein n=1 Tax=Pseudomonas sp. 7P_10.2_Bac1 TaxID=2971614 RepID=UPI0021C753F9|nr:hypothetical protein [Pseudomonas sp. 7P_10.2_Bac1]MCU1725607.1 hypothetical protein [Pseudomonas sp. 7P_10.2_Bac1]
MHGSEYKDGQHSTPEEDPRPKLWPRVLGSLVIVGVMVGMMIGRLTAPEPTELQQIEVQAQGLVVWFNHEPQLHGEWVDGTLGLLFAAKGVPQQGQLKLKGRDVNWRVRRTDAGLMLTLVAARPLKGDWAGAPQEGRWRLQVNLQE